MDIDRFHELRVIMDKAFSDKDFERAELLAREYLNMAVSMKDDWNYGNALHHGNLMLGRIALKENNFHLAKVHLMEAVETPGSPQLNTFGPNMSLAKELLQKGENEVVLDYINLTKKFWVKLFSWRKTRKWKREINNGVIPDFGPHLFY